VIEPLDAIALLLILLAVADVHVTIFLVRKARQNHEPALGERAIVSVILTTAAVLMAALSAAYLIDLAFPTPVGTALLVAGVVLISAPQLIWAALYWRGTFQ
jgi:hypothetical protein